MADHKINETNINQNVLEILRKNWTILLFIGGIIMGWSNIGSRLDYLEKRVEKLEALAESQQKSNNEITNAVVEIKANYLFIKEKLEKLDK